MKYVYEGEGGIEYILPYTVLYWIVVVSITSYCILYLPLFFSLSLPPPPSFVYYVPFHCFLFILYTRCLEDLDVCREE